MEGLIHRGAYFRNFKVTVCPKCNKLLQVRVRTVGPKYFSVISDVSNTPLRWLDKVFQGQYLPSLSINYVAMNKVLEKLPPQLY